MNKIRYKTVSLTYQDLEKILSDRGVEIFPGASVHLTTYNPFLEGMARADAGYINKDSELVLSVIVEEE